MTRRWWNRIRATDRRTEARLGGTYQAIVVATDDPEDRGRVRCRVPVVGDAAVWSPVLAPTPRSPRPELAPGDAVYVVFEDGDIGLPIVIGAPAAKP